MIYLIIFNLLLKSSGFPINFIKPIKSISQNNKIRIYLEKKKEKNITL